MSAEILRRAASLMRERAADVAATPWYCTSTDEERFNGYDVWTHDEESHWTVATSDYAPVAKHIVGMSPAVALAVADSLAHAAAVIDEAGTGPLAMAMRAIAEPLVTVATTYLNGEPA